MHRGALLEAGAPGVIPCAAIGARSMTRRLVWLSLAMFASAWTRRAPGGDGDGASPREGSSSPATTGDAATTTTGASEARYTYYRDVKAILDASCATCHRPGDIAPFSLQTGEEAVMFAPV